MVAAAAAHPRRAGGGRRPGPPRRPGRDELRAAGHRLGAEGRARADRGRPAGPGRRARPRWSAGTTAARCRRRSARCAARSATPSTPPRRRCWPRPRELRDARTVRGRQHRGGDRGQRSGVRPAAVAAGGRARARSSWPRASVTVRCLQRPDGSVPDDPDDPEVGGAGRPRAIDRSAGSTDGPAACGPSRPAADPPGTLRAPEERASTPWRGLGPTPFLSAHPCIGPGAGRRRSRCSTGGDEDGGRGRRDGGRGTAGRPSSAPSSSTWSTTAPSCGSSSTPTAASGPSASPRSPGRCPRRSTTPTRCPATTRSRCRAPGSSGRCARPDQFARAVGEEVSVKTRPSYGGERRLRGRRRRRHRRAVELPVDGRSGHAGATATSSGPARSSSGADPKPGKGSKPGAEGRVEAAGAGRAEPAAQVRTEPGRRRTGDGERITATARPTRTGRDGERHEQSRHDGGASGAGGRQGHLGRHPDACPRRRPGVRLQADARRLRVRLGHDRPRHLRDPGVRPGARRGGRARPGPSSTSPPTTSAGSPRRRPSRSCCSASARRSAS